MFLFFPLFIFVSSVHILCFCAYSFSLRLLYNQTSLLNTTTPLRGHATITIALLDQFCKSATRLIASKWQYFDTPIMVQWHHLGLMMISNSSDWRRTPRTTWCVCVCVCVWSVFLCVSVCVPLYV
jgi:hypothetical protein